MHFVHWESGLEEIGRGVIEILIHYWKSTCWHEDGHWAVYYWEKGSHLEASCL